MRPMVIVGTHLATYPTVIYIGYAGTVDLSLMSSGKEEDIAKLFGYNFMPAPHYDKTPIQIIENFTKRK